MLGDVLYQFLVSGVNSSLPGNGGDECCGFIPHWQKLLETIAFVWLACQGIRVSWAGLGVQNAAHERRKSLSSRSSLHSAPSNQSTASSPTSEVAGEEDDDDDSDIISLGPNQLHVDELRPMISEVHATVKTLTAGRILFTAYCTVFLSELIYKLVTRTGIFLLNPCHVTTILQLVLMRLPQSSEFVMRLFRVHLYMVPGALVAVLFPILNTRLMPGEVLIYYIQHLFILVIPFYLMITRETFTPEPILNMSWAIFSVSAFVLYHFVFLQIVGLLVRVNLNCILCPALSDPFSGRLYRVFAVAHQSVAIPVVAKLYAFVSMRWIAALYRVDEAIKDK